ncbi:hypothetical protein KBB96_05050 [Luteolibacter ambystomatis]|uniref:Uncharacterized protein n=1 Tax=Luteolibacter ambystomatis TaxID=2824561 RepID=A0A975J1F1_9BACT|nr:hypothetical protein [Luteolibacter ambystomatis]QUE52260.1 hypothetical protein KBB96_05050 [Luteolibacter ambystomatis]
MQPYTIHPPFFLLRSLERCWRCNEVARVFAFAASRCTTSDEELEDYIPLGGPFMLYNALDLPADLVEFARELGASIQRRYSKTAETEYYMNLCHCGAPFGDYFMFNEPGHAFFPTSEEEAAMIEIFQLPLPHPVGVDSGFTESDLSLIFECGIRR